MKALITASSKENSLIMTFQVSCGNTKGQKWDTSGHVKKLIPSISMSTSLISSIKALILIWSLQLCHCMKMNSIFYRFSAPTHRDQDLLCSLSLSLCLSVSLFVSLSLSLSLCVCVSLSHSFFFFPSFSLSLSPIHTFMVVARHFFSPCLASLLSLVKEFSLMVSPFFHLPCNDLTYLKRHIRANPY